MKVLKSELVDGFIEALLFAEADGDHDGYEPSELLVKSVGVLFDVYLSNVQNRELIEKYQNDVKNGRGFAHSMCFNLYGFGAGFFDEIPQSPFLASIEQSLIDLNFNGEVYFDDERATLEPDNWRCFYTDKSRTR